MCQFKKKLKKLTHKKVPKISNKKVKIKYYIISFNLNEPNINFI